jgi:hypothetical protein
VVKYFSLRNNSIFEQFWTEQSSADTLQCNARQGRPQFPDEEVGSRTMLSQSLMKLLVVNDTIGNTGDTAVETFTMDEGAAT